MVVLDPKPNIEEKIVKNFFHLMNTTQLENPYSVYIPVAELAVELQEDAVWKIRNEVRHVEKIRKSICPQPSNSQIHFCRLHDLARHAIHVSESLDLTNQILHRMIEHHARFMARPATPAVATEDDNEETRSTILETAHRNHNAHDQLRCYQDAIQNLRLRSIANKDRLQNEIQYSFNLVAQDIARTSNVIQDAVQVDSSVTKTVALVTAAFIPMTFAATVFGMQFFAYDVHDGSLNISDKFWMAWALGLSLTLLTALLSYFYYEKNTPKRRFLR